jgi:hypothetical protein
LDDRIAPQINEENMVDQAQVRQDAEEAIAAMNLWLNTNPTTGAAAPPEVNEPPFVKREKESTNADSEPLAQRKIRESAASTIRDISTQGIELKNSPFYKEEVLVHLLEYGIEPNTFPSLKAFIIKYTPQIISELEKTPERTLEIVAEPLIRAYIKEQSATNLHAERFIFQQEHALLTHPHLENLCNRIPVEAITAHMAARGAGTNFLQHLGALIEPHIASWAEEMNSKPVRKQASLERHHAVPRAAEIIRDNYITQQEQASALVSMAETLGVSLAFVEQAIRIKRAQENAKTGRD